MLKRKQPKIGKKKPRPGTNSPGPGRTTRKAVAKKRMAKKAKK